MNDAPPRVYLSAVRQNLLAWREEAARILIRHGHRLNVREPLSVGGKVEVTDLTDEVCECRLMLCVIDDAYAPAATTAPAGSRPDSPDAVTQREIETALRSGVPVTIFWHSDAEHPPVAVRQFQPLPARVDPHHLTTEDPAPVTLVQVHELREFREEVTVLAAALAVETWGLVTPLQLPPEAPHFTGRTAQIAWLEKELRHARAGDRLSLIGAGGAGKTAIAREAIARVAPDAACFSVFPGGVYMHDFYAAPSCEAFMDSILRAAGNSSIPPEQREETVRNLLTGEHCLVYAEGVEKLRDLIHSWDNLATIISLCGRAVLLLTSRHTMDAWETKSLAIDDLPNHDAACLLHAHATGTASIPAPDSACHEIASLLGGHPLALSLAGSLMRHSASTPASWLAALHVASFQTLPAELRPVESLRFFFHRHAAALTAPARDAWFALSLHGLSGVDRDTIGNCIGISESEARTALDELAAKGVAIPAPIRYTVSGLHEPGWRLAHPRFSEWGRSRLVDSGVPDSAIIARWKVHWFSLMDLWQEVQFVPGDANRQQLVFEYLRAFMASLARIEEPGSLDSRRALRKVGRAFLLLGRASDAWGSTDLAYRLNLAAHGDRHPRTLDCQHDLAIVLQYVDSTEAVNQMEAVLRLRSETAGKLDVLTLTSQVTLADILIQRNLRGDRKRAGAILRETLPLLAASAGSEAPETTICRRNLAAFLFAENDFAAAAPLYLAILEACPLREDGKDTANASDICTYAEILYALEDLPGAIAYWRRALSFYHRYGDFFNETLQVRRLLALALWEQGALSEAETFARELTSAYARHLPENHACRRDAENLLADIRRAATAVK